MLDLVRQLVAGLASGVLAPLAAYLNKREDTQLEGFRSAAGIDAGAYGRYLDYLVAVNAQKAAANSWWGARLLYLVVGGAAAAHTAAIFLDSTLKLGCGRYGCLGVPPLPGAYADYERMVVTSLFVASTVGPPLSAVTAWLHRRGAGGGDGRTDAGRAAP